MSLLIRKLMQALLWAFIPIIMAGWCVPASAATITSLFSRGYTVIPEPQQVDLKGGDFEFGSGWRLALGSGVKADDVAVESLKDGLSSRDGVMLESAGRGRAQGKVISLAIQSGSVQIGAAT